MDVCQCIEMGVAQLLVPQPQTDALVAQQMTQPNFNRGGHIMTLEDAERDQQAVMCKDRAECDRYRASGQRQRGLPRSKPPAKNEQRKRRACEGKGKEKLSDTDGELSQEEDDDESGSSLRGGDESESEDWEETEFVEQQRQQDDDDLRDDSAPLASSSLRSSLSSPQGRHQRPKKRVSFSLPPPSPSSPPPSPLLSPLPELASSTMMPFLVQRRHGGSVGPRYQCYEDKPVSLSVWWIDRLIVVLMIFLFAFAVKKSVDVSNM